MRKISASAALTVYHDGQFWVGLAERAEGGKLSVARVVFGPEPSAEEVQELVIRRWDKLRFTAPVEHEHREPASNPKRRQREAAREMRQRGPSTKAQAALSGQREAIARYRKSEASRKREQVKRERFERRQEKRKQKRRGH